MRLGSTRKPVQPVHKSRARRALFGTLVVAGGAIALASGYFLYSGAPNSFPLVASNAQAQASGVAGAGAALQDIELRNSVSRQASDWGVTACLDQIATVTDFLTTGVRYSALSQRGNADADRELFSAAIASSDRMGLTSISTISAAPVSDGCNSTYQTIAAFPMRCEQAHEHYFASFTEKMAFGGDITVYAKGGNSFVYLLPLGELGCTAIKTEVLYR